MRLIGCQIRVEAITTIGNVGLQYCTDFFHHGLDITDLLFIRDFCPGLEVITTGMRMNYIDMILTQNGSSLIREDQFFAVYIFLCIFAFFL